MAGEDSISSTRPTETLDHATTNFYNRTNWQPPVLLDSKQKRDENKMSTLINRCWALLLHAAGIGIVVSISANSLFAQSILGESFQSVPNGQAVVTYVNETNQIVNVLSTPVVPGGRPTIVQQLQPGQSYSRQRNVVGANVSFQLASGGPVEERTRPNHIGLVVTMPDRPTANGVTYVNLTGEVVNMFEQQGVSIPPRPPTYVRSLQPNEQWTDGPTRVSPLSFQLSSGIGQIREVQEETLNGRRTALVKIGQSTPGPSPQDTVTYLNKTGQNVQVFSQRAGLAPEYQQPAQYETTIGIGGSYQYQPMPGMSKSFRIADGSRVLEKSVGAKTVELVTTGKPTPGGNGNTKTYVNRTGQNVQVYSQMSGAPGFQQPMQYETTIPAGGTYQHRVMPGSSSKTFRMENGSNVLQRLTGGNTVELVATNGNGWQPMPGQSGNWGPWQPVPGSGQWQTVPGSGQWQTVPGNGQWQTVPGKRTVADSSWQWTVANGSW